MADNIYCTECHRHAVTERPLLDGFISACRSCGHQELVAGVDVEAQLRALDEIDHDLADSWRRDIFAQTPATTH